MAQFGQKTMNFTEIFWCPVNGYQFPHFHNFSQSEIALKSAVVIIFGPKFVVKALYENRLLSGMIAPFPLQEQIVINRWKAFAVYKEE